jgi:hypothetical protein
MQFMWAELCEFFLLVTIPPELRTFIIVYGGFDRRIQLVSYHSFYTYFWALPVTGISLELLIYVEKYVSTIAYVLSFRSPENAGFLISSIGHCCGICD